VTTEQEIIRAKVGLTRRALSLRLGRLNLGPPEPLVSRLGPRYSSRHGMLPEGLQRRAKARSPVLQVGSPIASF
jgi:hypothetical protein